MDPDSTWYGGRPRPMPHCARWGPSSPQREGCWMVGTKVGIGPDHTVLDGAQLPQKLGRKYVTQWAHVYCGQTVAHLSYC